MNSGNSIVEKTLEEVKAGDILISYSSQENKITEQKIIFKQTHLNDEGMSRILNFTLKNSKKTLSVTSCHYVFIRKSNETEMIHVPSRLASVGDSFFIQNDFTHEFEYDEIEMIQIMEVPKGELVSIYTDSLTFIGNGILASSKSEDDGVELVMGSLTFISDNVSVDLV